jgi:hypothetical protein
MSGSLRGFENQINVEKLRTVFVAFQEFFGMREVRLAVSRLADTGEEKHRFAGGELPWFDRRLWEGR